MPHDLFMENKNKGKMNLTLPRFQKCDPKILSS